MNPPPMSDLNAYLGYLTAQVQDVKNATDTVWISSMTYLVFLMQIGFSFLEAGSSRHKNHASTLIKNILDITVATLGWWLIGYGFAFGQSVSGVIGMTYFGGDQIDTWEEYTSWMFQWAFCGTASTIVSGCILERISIWGYVIFSCMMSMWIYPLIVHWCWSPMGWLKLYGYLDFAGSGVVHMVGGAAGLVGAIILGPRTGRFDKDHPNKQEFHPNYHPHLALGTIILWFCWYGFNCGSTLTIV
jgi:Amt family ammonium transporter